MSVKIYITIGLSLAALAGVWGIKSKIDGLQDALANEQKAHKATSDTLTTRTTERDEARTAGKLCSDSVDTLKKSADEARQAAKPVIDAAKQTQVTHVERAQVIMRTPATKPDDMWQSAKDRAARWQKEKAQK